MPHVDTGIPPTVDSAPKVCSPYVVGWILTAAGALGLAASLILTIEKFQLLADPSYRPSCSINPVLSCGSVMSSPQASIFGFPNSILGIVGFTVLLTTGIVTLTAAKALPQWVLALYRHRLAHRSGAGSLADFPKPVQNPGTVPILHGRVGGDDDSPLVCHFASRCS